MSNSSFAKRHVMPLGVLYDELWPDNLLGGGTHAVTRGGDLVVLQDRQLALDRGVHWKAGDGLVVHDDVPVKGIRVSVSVVHWVRNHAQNVFRHAPSPLEDQLVDCRPPSPSIWCEETVDNLEDVVVHREEEVQCEL